MLLLSSGENTALALALEPDSGSRSDPSRDRHRDDSPADPDGS